MRPRKLPKTRESVLCLEEFRDFCQDGPERLPAGVATRDLVDPLKPRQTQDSIFLPLSLEAKGVSSQKRGYANWLDKMKCRQVRWERPELCWWPNLGHTLFSLKATEGVRAVGSLGSWRQGGK